MWIAVRKTENQKCDWKIKGPNQEGHGRNDVQEFMKKELTGFVNNRCYRHPCYVNLGWASSIGISWKPVRNVGSQAPLETNKSKFGFEQDPQVICVYTEAWEAVVKEEESVKDDRLQSIIFWSKDSSIFSSFTDSFTDSYEVIVGQG